MVIWRYLILNIFTQSLHSPRRRLVDDVLQQLEDGHGLDATSGRASSGGSGCARSPGAWHRHHVDGVLRIISGQEHIMCGHQLTSVNTGPKMAARLLGSGGGMG